MNIEDHPMFSFRFDLLKRCPAYFLKEVKSHTIGNKRKAYNLIISFFLY